MQLTNAIFAGLSLLSVASASPKPQIRSVLPINPLERRGIDCTNDEDRVKCICEACDETKNFQVGTPSIVPDDACTTITMPVVRYMTTGGITGWTCETRNDEKYAACCNNEDIE